MMTYKQAIEEIQSLKLFFIGDRHELEREIAKIISRIK